MDVVGTARVSALAIACLAQPIGAPAGAAQPALPQPPAQARVLGLWLTDDRAGIVDIAPCGARLCGKLVSVLDPHAPDRDIHNPDTRLRSRPLAGIAVLSGLMPRAGGASGGDAYDPKAGRHYRASIRLAHDGRLDVTGCLLFVCRTRHWTRIRETRG